MREAAGFYHQHLGQHLMPGAIPSESISPSLPTRTKRAREARVADSSAPLDVRRIGTGMPVFYIVTEAHSWLLSNTEPPEHPAVTPVRIDDENGKLLISGTQYIAHWLYHDAPTDRPFMIGSIEKATPLPSLCVSLPPQRVHFCTTSAKTGSLTINLKDYRDDIKAIIESDVPWADVKKGKKIQCDLSKVSMSDDGQEAAGKVAALRKNMHQLLKKYPGFLNVLSGLQVMTASPNEKLMDWFFVNGNVWGKR